MADEKITTSKQKTAKKDFVSAVGRRREAIARIRIYQSTIDGIDVHGIPAKKGEIIVNNKPIIEYFGEEITKSYYTEPFRITNTLGKYIVTIKVAGGGKSGQIDAITHGIARALALLDVEKHRPILKKKGMLTRDSRIRERRKVGTGGKARRKKQSPKR